LDWRLALGLAIGAWIGDWRLFGDSGTVGWTNHWSID